jgi:GNAT superfamily N-acetyltransferase
MISFKQFLLDDTNKIDFNDLKSKYTASDDTHRIDVFNSSGAVGYIEWGNEDGEIEKVFVGRPYRRQGVGTHLWDLAVEWAMKNNAVEPEHSSGRSKEGDAFARSIGGYIPDLTDDIDGWSRR